MEPETPAPPAAPSAAPNGARRRRSLAIFFSVLLAGAVLGAVHVIRGLGFEETDDAFLASNVYQVSARVAGRLASVPVKQNQLVAAGELLAEVASDDYAARVAEAHAALELAQAATRAASIDVGVVDAGTAAGRAQAEAELGAAEARLAETRAEAEAARSEAERAGADLARYSSLSELAVSRQRLDEVRSTSTAAASSLAALEKRVSSSEADLAAARARLDAAVAERARVDAARAEVERRSAEERRAQAALDAAQLELSYTRIVAPAAGRVTNKAALAGDYAAPGRVLMSVVSPDVWVVANFKETQLERMRIGQPARVHVDAYDLDLDAHVDSVQAGSGAQFSLLPPQNATGNYVKVVQRVPVKLVFEAPPDPAHWLLGPGMSVVPRVDVR